jgi:hypothetical protein
VPAGRGQFVWSQWFERFARLSRAKSEMAPGVGMVYLPAEASTYHCGDRYPPRYPPAARWVQTPARSMRLLCVPPGMHFNVRLPWATVLAS